MNKIKINSIFDLSRYSGILDKNTKISKKDLSTAKKMSVSKKL